MTHERSQRTYSLPADTVQKLQNFFKDYKDELNTIGIKNMPQLLEVLAKMGIPYLTEIMEKVKSESPDITRKENIRSQRES